MITLPPDFKDFLRLLSDHEVAYLLVGGYAVAMYGYVRYTADLDIWVLMSAENASKVVSVLQDFGLPSANELLEVFQNEKRVVGMGMPPYKIEVITSIDGVKFEECYSKKRIIEIDGIQINFISLEDLRINKAASGRFKDLNDLEHLMDK
jgi:predicted nucleotidyltransferase